MPRYFTLGVPWEHPEREKNISKFLVVGTSAHLRQGENYSCTEIETALLTNTTAKLPFARRDRTFRK